MERLVEILREFSPEEINEIERNDRQFKALERLYERFKEREEEFYRLVLINALMSYQLQMKGEEYWEKFAEFFSNSKGMEDFEEFLKRFNRRFLSAKLKRLKKAIDCVSQIKVEQVRDAGQLVEELAKCMGQRKDSKTIVFAVKMLNYAVKVAEGDELEGLEEIAIPLDSRIGRISKDRDFWRKLSEKTGILQIKLDAIFWICQNEEHLKSLPEELRMKLEKVRERIFG
ncbi:DNA-(apurinic or apyrimidinic site) lyase [Desulfurobacterium pacificum]|uniref:DNA-(Apurinic or apyrimidinic site) lyase n=1 Tax=Desulfurobacterium pacificum TaxID=240166 RepID=A0ABY1NRF6_9BACT|nr:N-glycosylase/DNA lyase [Desulfurobacterium pacificum]SMP16049.1 DNA-(apurinic or apyrimidinic site) lyase [Desulfurobacterium pacificum]